MSAAPAQDILLIEPSSLTGSIIVATARQLNLPRVSQVASVRTAQQQMAHHKYGSIILSLDEQDAAIGLLEQVRQGAYAVPSDVPVVVTTPQVNAATATRMRALQVRRVLLTPFKVRDVIGTIQLLSA